MAEGLQIQIGANVSNAIQGLNQVQTELEQTGKDAAAFSNSVDKATVKLRQLPNVTGQTSAALTNFGRVIQDAPYGIIGIANNIDPLVTSFNQLKTSTGSTKAALGELLSGLAGPAGIAIAISSITSLLVKFGDQLFTSSKEMSNAELSSISYSGSLEKIAESLDKLRDSLEFGNAIANLDNQLKGLSGSELDIANSLSQIGNNNKYISELDNKIAPLKKRFNDAAVEAKKYISETKKFQDIPAEQFAPGAQQYILGKRAELDAFYSYYLEFGKINEDLLKNLSKSDQMRFADLQKSNTQLSKLEDERLAFQNKNAILEKQIQLDRYKKEKEIIDKTIAEAKKISDFAGNVISIRFKITPLDDEATIYKAAKEYLEKFRAGLYDYTLTAPPIEIDIPTVFPGESPNLEKGVSAFGAVLSKEINDYFKSNTVIDYSLILEQLKSNAAKGQDKFSFLSFSGLTKEAQELAQTGQMIANMFTPSLEAMIDAIGRGENAFKAFGEGVKAVLVQVIQKLTATAILAGVLAALFPGGIGGSKGFGAIFGKLLGFRANGGPVTGNSPYIVGERGPELFVPSVSGSIVPNNAVGSFMSGRSGDSGRGSILRGQDIILAYARTQRSQLRVNG